MDINIELFLPHGYNDIHHSEKFHKNLKYAYLTTDILIRPKGVQYIWLLTYFFFYFLFNQWVELKKKLTDCCINTSNVDAAISPAKTLYSERGTPHPPPEYTDQCSQPLAVSADQMLVF